ncbi:MAG: carbon storage regulator [Gammaproteobacteria bacterium]
MLVLSRQTGEAIVCGESADLEIKILSISRGWVKIGIQAPRNIPIFRKEILQRLPKEKKEKVVIE